MLDLLKVIWELFQWASVAFTVFFLFGLYNAIRQELRLRDTVEKIEQRIKLVYTEKVDDVWYVYDAITNQFVTQAKSESEAYERVKAMFPGYTLTKKTD